MHLGDKKNPKPTQLLFFFSGFQTYRKQLLNDYVVVLEIQEFRRLSPWMLRGSVWVGLGLRSQLCSLQGANIHSSLFRDWLGTVTPHPQQHSSHGQDCPKGLILIYHRLNQLSPEPFESFSPESWKPKPWRPATAEASAVPTIYFFLSWSLLSDEKQTQEQTKA